MVVSKHSIAVLPFMNMSCNAEEYFSDGITEEIINALANIEGLHVTARTSSFAFKNMNADVREIGRQLNVSLIMVRYRSAPILFILIDPLWDNLRDHPAYISTTAILRDAALTIRPALVVKKYRKTSLPKETAHKLKSDLKDLMLKERPYLDQRLNLSDLSEMINCSPNQLSQLLNESIGKNFYDYVNEYRLGHFRELTRKPGNKQFTFLSLAYESGFNSKSTFNSFFKKSTGVTPSEYLK